MAQNSTTRIKKKQRQEKNSIVFPKILAEGINGGVALTVDG